MFLFAVFSKINLKFVVIILICIMIHVAGIKYMAWTSHCKTDELSCVC